MTTRWLTPILCLGLFVGPLARAETPREEAARHTRSGLSLFELQRYGEAETEFSAAYALAPEPELLYDLARVRAAMGRHADAAETLDRFIATQPPSAELARAEALANEEHKLAVATPKKRFPYPASVALGVATIGLGAISLSTGLVSHSAYHDLEHCAACDGERSYGRRLQVVSLATLVIGAATFIGGVIAVPYEHKHAKEASR